MSTTSPQPLAQLELEHERRRLARLVAESAEVLRYHDLRRQGLEGTHATYQRLLADIDLQLNPST